MAVKPEPTVVTIKVDDAEFTMTAEDLTGEQDRLLFQQSGLTVAQVIDAATSGAVGIFTVAAMVFLARLQAGEKNVDYKAIESGITFQSDVSLDFGGQAPKA